MTAIVFVADPERTEYQRDSSVGTIAAMVSVASGPFGKNAEYVFQLDRALEELGTEDNYVATLAAAVHPHRRGTLHEVNHLQALSAVANAYVWATMWQERSGARIEHLKHSMAWRARVDVRPRRQESKQGRG